MAVTLNFCSSAPVQGCNSKEGEEGESCFSKKTPDSGPRKEHTQKIPQKINRMGGSKKQGVKKTQGGLKKTGWRVKKTRAPNTNMKGFPNYKQVVEGLEYVPGVWNGIF